MLRREGVLASEEQGVVYVSEGGAPASSLLVNRAIMAASARAVDVELAHTMQAARDWRTSYPVHGTDLTVRAMRSADDALAMARAGLDEVERWFGFARDGQQLGLREAMATFTDEALHTVEVKGAAKPRREWTVPYQGRQLSGQALRDQIARWIDADVLEPTAMSAMSAVIDHPEWLDLSHTHVAMLGASAEVGPLRPLLDLGAHVWAVDLPREDLWARTIKAARERAGTLHIPTRRALDAQANDETIAAYAGANLLTDAPEIRTWLLGAPEDLTVGAYAYMNGKKFVQVSVAMDAITREILAARPDASCASLLTPTDSYAVPAAAAERAASRLTRRVLSPALASACNALTRGRLYTPNVCEMIQTEAGRWGAIDSSLIQQGPNYTLAKRIQRWRALIARAEGHLATCNVAPATSTASVTQKRLFRAGYEGSEYFGIEIFAPETTNALMTGLLIHDLRAPDAPARPTTALAHPDELFMHSAMHGGFWRMSYQLRSVLHPAVILGLSPLPAPRR